MSSCEEDDTPLAMLPPAAQRAAMLPAVAVGALSPAAVQAAEHCTLAPTTAAESSPAVLAPAAKPGIGPVSTAGFEAPSTLTEAAEHLSATPVTAHATRLALLEMEQAAVARSMAGDASALAASIAARQCPLAPGASDALQNQVVLQQQATVPMTNKQAVGSDTDAVTALATAHCNQSNHMLAASLPFVDPSQLDVTEVLQTSGLQSSDGLDTQRDIHVQPPSSTANLAAKTTAPALLSQETDSSSAPAAAPRPLPEPRPLPGVSLLVHASAGPMPDDTDRQLLANHIPAVLHGDMIEDSESEAEPNPVQALRPDPRLLHGSESIQKTSLPASGDTVRPQGNAQVPQQSREVHQHDQGGQPGLDSTVSLMQAEAQAAHLHALIARHEQSVSPAASHAAGFHVPSSSGQKAGAENLDGMLPEQTGAAHTELADGDAQAESNASAIAESGFIPDR